MNTSYWLLLFFFILIGSFQIYLVFWDRRIEYHAQNLTDGKLPTWRHGRCWWYLTSNDDQKWFHGPGARLEWSIFPRDSGATLDITVLGDDGDDIQLHIKIPFLISIFFTLERLPLLHRIPYKWRRNYGYETSIKWFSRTLWLHFFYSDMWGTTGWPRINWAKRWKAMPKARRPRRLWKLYKAFARLMWWLDRKVPLHIWASVGYQEYRGVGFYISFDFDRLILGSRERTEENIGEPIVAEIPIEPDNSLGLHYFAKFQRQKEIRWRGHFPWRKTITYLVDIETDAPPMHAGKGENSWDLDDDGIFGWSPQAATIEEAIAMYQEHVYRDRKKYGMPNAVDRAQRGAM